MFQYAYLCDVSTFSIPRYCVINTDSAVKHIQCFTLLHSSEVWVWSGFSWLGLVPSGRLLCPH